MMFLSFDKDDDCRITLKQLGKVFEKMYGKDYDAELHYSSLIGSIKIDFSTFIDFHEKYKLRHLLEQLEDKDPDEETKKKIYKAMDIDGNGLISEFEFKEWSKKILQVDSDVEDEADVQNLLAGNEKEIEGVFKKLDKDGDGQVTF